MKGLTKNSKLNDAMTDKLQNYYGIAIRKNIGKDLPAMKKAVWAGGFHAASSVNNMWHDHCPNGKESWCAYQYDIANNTSFCNPPKTGLTPFAIPCVKPILEDLTEDSLLSKCLHGKMQNQNESFNGMIWRRVPKDTYVGLRQFELGVYDAVSHFNIGNAATLRIYQKLGITPDENTIRGLDKGNFFRISNSIRKSSDVSKLRRRYLRGVRKSKKDALCTKEGKTYASGGF